MAWTFCTSGAAVAKAGANANTTITASGAALKRWSEDVESTINAESRYDWTASYSSLGDNYKKALSHVASAMIAQNIISYDLTSYIFSESTTMLNFLDNQIKSSMSFLKKKEYQEKF